MKRSIQEPEIKYYPTEEVEFMVVDVLQLDLLKKGKFRIGGLVLLKKDIEGVYRLTIKDGEGEKEIRWGLPSPVLASRYPDNPKGKEARFEINNVSINKDSPLEIYLKEKDTSKLLVRISLGGVRA